MEDRLHYDVIYTGDVKPGFDTQQICSDLAKMLKINPDKAKSVLSTKRILKKDLDANKAKLYQTKLENIGLSITLKAVEQQVQPSLKTLSLEPTEEEKASSQITSTPNGLASFSCPKCQLEQATSEQCKGCGIYFHKYKASDAEAAQDVTPQENSEEAQEEAITLEEAPTLNVVAIAAAGAAALVGALLWMFIATTFGYEHSLVALIVGSAVGYAAAYFGGRGQASGIVCALLAFIAIFAGKYFAYQSFQNDWLDILTEELGSAEFQLMYEEDMQAARTYVEGVTDDNSMKQFIVDYEYSDYSTVDAVTQDELNYFRENIDPYLRSMANSSITYDQWFSETFGAGMEEVSTLDLMKEDFGILDIIFLFLGLGAAFRLGSGETKD